MQSTNPQPPASTRFRAAEFFAGVGLVGDALAPEGIEVIWANDIDPVKERLFKANHDSSVFRLGDVRRVTGEQLRDIELATASFPCTDVSIAGNRAGLAGAETGMFYEFHRVLEEMGDRAPAVILLENVVGLSSSNGGEDLKRAFGLLNDLGYICDLVHVDARWFVPQSRPRIFIVGSKKPLPPELSGDLEHSPLRPAWYKAFVARHAELRIQTFALTPPVPEAHELDTVTERLAADDHRWWDDVRRQAFLDSLSEINAGRLEELRQSDSINWRTAYRRTRHGKPVWEIRADAIAGCLRTARGGSSKQALVEAGQGEVRLRWMTAREYARLQGAPDFVLSDVSESQAMFGFGDAVCVPAVRWLVARYIVPLLEHAYGSPDAASEEQLRALAGRV